MRLALGIKERSDWAEGIEEPSVKNRSLGRFVLSIGPGLMLLWSRCRFYVSNRMHDLLGPKCSEMTPAWMVVLLDGFGQLRVGQRRTIEVTLVHNRSARQRENRFG